MLMTLIHLLQGQASKISWLLWTAAILVFLVGLALLIYLMTRSKESDQLDELEEGGSGLLSREKLHAELDGKKSEAQNPPLAPVATISVNEKNADSRQTIPLFSEADFRKKADHQSAAVPLESNLESFVETKSPPPSVAEEILEEEVVPPSVQASFEPEAEPSITVDAPPVSENRAEEIQEESDTTPTNSQTLVEPTPVIKERSTQVLTSQKAPTVEQKTIPFETQEEQIYSPQEEALLSQKEMSLAQENSSARVDAPLSQQRLEQTATFRREPFEPPTIEPLAPKPTTTQQLSSQTYISAIDESREAKTTALSSQPSQKQTVISSSEAVLPEPPILSPADFETLPLSTKRKPAGSVLGIPAETSHAPLILGQPSRAIEDKGVAALSNYDKDLDAAETGRGGAIALLIAILLIGGAALAYYLVPAVRSRADAVIARMRGQQTTAPAPVEKPKAQIFPSRNPEVVKNLVKARGAVTNISEEPLEELSVEVSLDRGEGTTAETRIIPVKPTALAPQQRGLYEFEYEGGKATGFSRYRVTKLLSKNGEVKFTTPNQ